MKEMFSDVSVKTSIFQPCSFISSLIYSGTFEEDRKVLPLSTDANQQFTGWRGKEQCSGEIAGREREAAPGVLSVPVLEILPIV